MGEVLSNLWKAIGKKYITGVLNDFSTVSKAVFYSFKKKGDNKGYKFEEILPVQINPNRISRNYAKFVGPKSQQAKDIAKKLGDNGPAAPPEPEKDSLSLDLVYDIYDEWNVATRGGVVEPIYDKCSDGWSLYSKKLSSLGVLQEYASAGSNEYLLAFKWGSTDFTGRISSFSCDYEAFSVWGDPLKANAHITLEQAWHNGAAYTLEDLLKEEDNLKGKAEIEVYEIADLAFTEAALIAETAMR